MMNLGEHTEFGMKGTLLINETVMEFVHPECGVLCVHTRNEDESQELRVYNILHICKVVGGTNKLKAKNKKR
jgi:hypothetical protein